MRHSVFKRLRGATLAACLSLIPLAGMAAADTVAPPRIPATTYTPVSPEDQVVQMGAGINIGGGYETWWTGQPSPFNPETDFPNVAAAGFKTIRVPLFTFAHLKSDGSLDPAWLARLDTVVATAEANHLNIILDEHDFDDCEKDTDACAGNLSNVWYDLSQRYRNEPNTVMFELLNEPHGKITYQLWNSWLSDLVSIVRETNPTRNLIIGPVDWNGLDQLPNLKLPADPHIIVTFHYYQPMEFTHQGASWVPTLTSLRGVHWTGSADEMAFLNSNFDKVTAWAKTNNHPIFLGEYGSYGHVNSDMDDRAAWTRAVSKAADERGFARAYWYYADGDGFGVWDADQKAWRKPLLKALLPDSPAAQ